MTPKEKARKIVAEYFILDGIDWDTAKKCALICVDKILECEPLLPNSHKPFSMNTISIRLQFIEANSYWTKVKNEIKLL